MVLHLCFVLKFHISLTTFISWSLISDPCQVGHLEGTLFLHTGHLVRLSQQALVDCSWGFGNNGCDGGEDFRAYQVLYTAFRIRYFFFTDPDPDPTQNQKRIRILAES